MRIRHVGLGLVMMLVAACSNGRATETGAVVDPITAPVVSTPPAAELPPEGASVDDATEPSGEEPVGGVERSPLADLVRPADDLAAPDELAEPLGPAPTGLSIPDLGITDASVRDVGVEPNGEMEIPGAREIGWYRWSSSPGQQGSSVLAAHVAFNGSDGVFRNLRDLDIGARFTVHYEDGSNQDFLVTERAQYGKDALPFDRVFGREGEPELVLITCGGSFNRNLNSYDDNVVAYATPV